jgi:hypothetical protein
MVNRQPGPGRIPVQLLRALAAAVVLAVPAAAQDGGGSSLLLRLGPTFHAHSDLLASPFRQRGSGIDGALAYRRGSFAVELQAGTAVTASGDGLTAAQGGVEDVWAGALDLTWTTPVTRFAGAEVGVGAGLSAVASVRRHHYLGGSTEFFADLLAPLSVAANAARPVGSRGLLQEGLSLSVATLLFRSPFAGAKTFPGASLSGPWETHVARHRLALDRDFGPRLRIGLSHGLTLIASSRQRDLRIVRQDLTATVTVVLGSAP